MMGETGPVDLESLGIDPSSESVDTGENKPGWAARVADDVLERTRLSGRVGRQAILFVLGLGSIMSRQLSPAAQASTDKGPEDVPAADVVPEAERNQPKAESAPSPDGSALRRTRLRRQAGAEVTRAFVRDHYGPHPRNVEQRLDRGWLTSLREDKLHGDVARRISNAGSPRKAAEELAAVVTEDLSHFNAPDGSPSDMNEVVQGGRQYLGFRFCRWFKALLGVDLGNLIGPDNPTGSSSGAKGLLSGDQSLREVIDGVTTELVDTKESPIGESAESACAKFSENFAPLSPGFKAALTSVDEAANAGAQVLQLMANGENPQDYLAPVEVESVSQAN